MSGDTQKGRLEATWHKIEQYVFEKPKFFITMTAINKVGVNPRFGYGNPVGIYCYQLTPDIFRQLKTNKLPFVGEKPYIQVFTIDEKVFDIKSYTETALDHDCAILRKEYRTWNQTVSFERLLSRAEWERSGTAFGVLWWLTNLLAAVKTNSNIDEPSQARTLLWRKLLVMLGITNVVDPGLGIIHENEPTQSVILDPRIVKQVATIINPYAAKPDSNLVDTADDGVINNNIKKRKPTSKNDKDTKYTGKVVYELPDGDKEVCYFENGLLNDPDEKTLAWEATMDGKPWRRESWSHGKLKFKSRRTTRNGLPVWTKEVDGALVDFFPIKESLASLIGLTEARKTTHDALLEGVGAHEYANGELALIDFYAAANAIQEMTPEAVNQQLLEGDASKFISDLNIFKAFCEFEVDTPKRPYAKIFAMAAEKGYGPMMYYVVASKSKSGFIGSDNSVSAAAINIWEFFQKDTSIERKMRPEILTPDGKYDPREWEYFKINGPDSESTKYIYKPIDPNLSFKKLQLEARVGEKFLQDTIAGKLKDLQPKETLAQWFNHGLKTALYASALLYFNKKYYA